LPTEILEVVCVLLNEVGQLYKTIFLRGDYAQLHKLRISYLYCTEVH